MRVIEPRFLQTLAGNPAPFTMAELEAKCNQICGCEGQYNCDCVSVKNQAARQLWYEHNTRKYPVPWWHRC